MIGYLPPIVPPGRRGGDLVFEVEEATTRSARGHFVGFPRHLYRGDRRWIPRAGSTRRDSLYPSRNPLLRGAEPGAFMGVAPNLGLGDETVGLLAAWSAPTDPEDRERGWACWGLFDAANVEELAGRLFHEAENWLFEHTPGIAGIRGPCSLEPLVAPGLLTDGFDAETMALLPYNPPYYPEMVEGQGYEPRSTWRSYSLDLPADARRVVSGIPAGRVVWASIYRAYAGQNGDIENRGALVPGLLPWLDHLAGGAPFRFTRSWQSAVGRAFRRSITIISEEDGGEGTAACFGIPDIGAALRLSGGRRLPFGWLLFEIGLRRAKQLHVFPVAAPESWQVAQVAGLYARIAERASQAGFQRIGIAPVYDDDKRNSQALLALGARPAQQFTVYEKAL